MVYYKRIVCDEGEVGKVIAELRPKHNYISLYFSGHPKHGKYGLAEDKVLVIAHKA